jgi:hypothetical protein
MHARIHAYMHTYIHAYTHTHTHTYTHIHTFIHAYVHAVRVLTMMVITQIDFSPKKQKNLLLLLVLHLSWSNIGSSQQ